MNLSGALKSATMLLRKNQPQILLGFAVGGVVTTAYLTVKATWAAKEIIDQNEMVDGPHEDPIKRFKERSKETWPLFMPPAVAGFGTVTCMVFASRGQTKRTAAAIAAYSFTEKAFSEYREKAIEQLGAAKEQKIRTAIAQDKVNERPPTTQVIIAGKGEVLCCELYTMRYFKSDMESLRKAVNDINKMVIDQIYVSLDEFYYLVGLEPTAGSPGNGWEASRMLELEFDTAMAPDGTPCITFDYNYVRPLWT